jgi:hypothetical protein
VKQNPQGISCDIFDKRPQPEYAGIDIICMPHVHSNISITAKLGVIYCQYYRFLRLFRSKDFFVSQIVSLILLLKNKGYPLKVLHKVFFSEFQHLEYYKWFCIESYMGSFL